MLEGRSNYSTMQIIRVDGHQFPQARIQPQTIVWAVREVAFDSIARGIRW
jgi:hypothetical protein